MLFDPDVRAPRTVPVFDWDHVHVADIDIDDIDRELESGQYEMHVDLGHHAWLRLKHDERG